VSFNFMNKNMLDRMFKQVDNVVWDMMSGKVGFKTNEGIMTIDLDLEASTDANAPKPTEAPNAQVSLNLFDDFGMPIPAFAQSTAPEAIQLGDMIYANNKVMGWVVKKNEKSYKIMKADGTRTDWTPPKTQMLGFDSGIMVLRSLLNMLPGGATGLESMQGNLSQFMMMSTMMGGNDGDTEDTLKDIMPMMLMSQMGGAGGSTGGGFQQMMPMLMMMKMMKGNSRPSNRSNGKEDYSGINRKSGSDFFK